MAITWRELKEAEIPDEYMDFPVSVYSDADDENFEVASLEYEETNDVLSEGEPFLRLDN